MDNQNLFVALRAGFPTDLGATAIETADTPRPLYYSSFERGGAAPSPITNSPGERRTSFIPIELTCSWS